MSYLNEKQERFVYASDKDTFQNKNFAKTGKGDGSNLGLIPTY